MTFFGENNHQFFFCPCISNLFSPSAFLFWAISWNGITQQVSDTHATIRAFCTLIFYARSLLLTLLVLRPPLPGDNAVKIILVTWHATCRCNFAAISNFLDSLALPVLPHPPRPFPFAKTRRRCGDRTRGEKQEEKELSKEKKDAYVKADIHCVFQQKKFSKK